VTLIDTNVLIDILSEDAVWTLRRRLYIYFKRNTEIAMTTTITVKGQVTLPKKVREAAGLKPGDKVEVRATSSGGVYIEKPGRYEDYKARLNALAKHPLIQDHMTTDEFMKMMRGDPAEDPPVNE